MKHFSETVKKIVLIKNISVKSCFKKLSLFVLYEYINILSRIIVFYVLVFCFALLIFKEKNRLFENLISIYIWFYNIRNYLNNYEFCKCRYFILKKNFSMCADWHSYKEVLKREDSQNIKCSIPHMQYFEKCYIVLPYVAMHFNIKHWIR